MSTRCAAAINSSVGQLMARQSMPTAYATSGLEDRRPASMALFGLVRSASSTSLSRDSEAGARVRDIFLLGEADGGSVGGDVDVEEVCHHALVLDIPSAVQGLNEGIVEQADPVVCVQCE
eukprot:4206532-Pleurochrysis_carterae.AAC.1